MKIKILSRKHNPLLRREEVVFELDHREEGQTSSRLNVRENLANALKTKLDLVFVEKVETKTGTMIAIGTANAYESGEQAKLVELKHIIARNVPPKKPAEAEKRAEAEKPKVAEPAEKKPTEERKAAETEPHEETKEEELTSKPEEGKEQGEKIEE